MLSGERYTETSDKVNVLDLFSNIGGHTLGLRDAGDFRTVAFCEIDDRRRRFIQGAFPGAPVYRDIRELSGQRLWDDGNTVSIQAIIGGPPCQRTSVAAAIHGRRDGETLWPEMLRICNDIRPQWIVVEQPPGNAEWEAEVASGLARSGYHTARSEFAASDLGAPHIRRRVFILANPCLSRLQIAWQAIPQEIDRIARATATGNPWHAGPPRTLRVAHGVSGWLDRNAAVEAIGDANPPAMATVIGRAINVSHNWGVKGLI